MADTETPTTGAASPARAPRTSPGRRKTDVAPKAQAADRRTRLVQFIIFAIAAVVTIDALVGEKGLIQTYRASREQAVMVSSIAQLRRDNARLREHARRLREDPSAIEEIARRKHGLIKPGEVLVIVKDAEKAR
ncbi:MAG: septum formation initiator family protein [Acidobacteriota bacterium]|nr:septum formation initiator family protein [Acidobacteriota bacterium]